MKSAAFVVALVGLMVLVAGGIGQIQARSGTVMDFCPPQGTMNCAIVAKFWLKQAHPSDKQISGVADAIVASSRDRTISARACADTADALRALAAAATSAELRVRITELAELLCARQNGIASLSHSLLPDIFGREIGGQSSGSSGSSGPSWPAGFYYGYDIACDTAGQDCHVTCRTGSAGRETADCPPPPSGTIVHGGEAYNNHEYQWTCDTAGQSCHWDCLGSVSGHPDTCTSPPSWGNGAPTDGGYGPGTGWAYYGYTLQCDGDFCHWTCSAGGHGATYCDQPPAGTIGSTDDHYYQWSCPAGQACEWTCLDPDRDGAGACGSGLPGWNEDGSSGNSAGCGRGDNLSGCDGGTSGSSGQSSGSSGEGASSSGASGQSSGSSGQVPPDNCDGSTSSSGASGSSGQSCDGGGTSGSSGQSSGSSGEGDGGGTSGSSGQSSGSSGEGDGGGTSGSSGQSSGSTGEGGTSGTSGSSGQSSGTSGSSGQSSGEGGDGGEPPV